MAGSHGSRMCNDQLVGLGLGTILTSPGFGCFNAIKLGLGFRCYTDNISYQFITILIEMYWWWNYNIYSSFAAIGWYSLVSRWSVTGISRLNALNIIKTSYPSISSSRSFHLQSISLIIVTPSRLPRQLTKPFTTRERSSSKISSSLDSVDTFVAFEPLCLTTAGLWALCWSLGWLLCWPDCSKMSSSSDPRSAADANDACVLSETLCLTVVGLSLCWALCWLLSWPGRAKFSRCWRTSSKSFGSVALSCIRVNH